MKRIKFTKRTVFETHGPNNPENPVFEVDQVEDMTDDQAERWLRRGKAELVEDLGPDVDPVIAGADPAKVAELRDAIARENESALGELQSDLDDAARDLDKARGDQDGDQ